MDKDPIKSPCSVTGTGSKSAHKPDQDETVTEEWMNIDERSYSPQNNLFRDYC